MSDSTARIGLQIVGTVVGFVVGGPAGAMVGSMLGSVAGMVFFPGEDQTYEGPRLNDLQVQSSAYGGTIPIVFGLQRVTGNVIYAEAIRETRTEQELGGKGGPSQTQVTYTYDCTFAIALAEGEIASIRRIWADSRLIYDMTAQANGESLKVSGETAQYFTFYHGTETQEPDPTMEVALGIGNVPAYLGLAYVVFRRFPLSDYGNRIPNFSFELSEFGEPDNGRQVAETTGLVPSFKNHLAPTSSEYPLPFISTFGDVVRTGYQYSDDPPLIATAVSVFDLNGALLTTELATEFDYNLPTFNMHGDVLDWYGVWRLGEGVMRLKTPNAAIGVAEIQIVVGDQEINIHDTLPEYGETLRGIIACADNRSFVIVTDGATPLDPFNWYLHQWNGDTVSVLRSGTVSQDTSPDSDEFGISPVSQRIGAFEAGMMEEDLRHIWLVEAGGVYVWSLDDDDVMRREIVFEDAGLPHKVMGIAGAYVGMYATRAMCAVIGSDSAGATKFYIYTRLPNGATEPVTVGDIVTEICGRADLEPADIDVSDLTEECDGYAIASSMSARAAIEPLTRVYPFLGVESGEIIRFPLRYSAPVASITVDELGASDGGELMPLVEHMRIQEAELPARLTVRYRAIDADFQSGAQSIRRETTLSEQTIEANVPIALTDDRAAQAADVLMSEAWFGRNLRSFKTTNKYTTLEPGDVVYVADDAGEYLVRIMTKKDTGSMVSFDAVDVAQSAYSSSAVGATTPGGQTITIVKAATRLEVMDIPQLRDIDDDPGMYVAVAPIGNGAWPGATIYKGFGGVFNPLMSMFSGSPMGRSTTELGDFTGGNIFDETNSVTVELSYGTLSSITTLEVLNGGNVALLGSELIQFREADLVSGSIYTLSGLLRGRKGTEWAIPDHAEGERFVLLSADTTRRIPVALGDVGSTAIYRPQTIGRPLDVSWDQTVTHAGNAIECLSPVHLSAVRLAPAGDIGLSWVRRARLSAGWNDDEDVPLDEPTEEYEVEIWNAGNTAVLRTIETTTAEYTYTSSMQTTDFGSSPSTLNWRVYQIGYRLGRGFAGTATSSV